MVMVELRMPAQPGEVFSTLAADLLVGQKPRLKLRTDAGAGPAIDYGETKITAARVVDGGTAVLLTLEVQEEQLHLTIYDRRPS